MALASRTTRLLCATAAGLGTLLVAARVAPGHDSPDGVVQPSARAAAPSASAALAALATVPRTATVAAREAGASDSVLDLGRRDRTIPGTEGDAFAKLNWQPPPPPAPPAAPAPPPVAPPPPAAPPLPFAFVGMVERGAGKPQAFLAKGEALLVVAAGDVIENNTYRVDSLSPSSVVLTYLPLGKQQTINVAGGSK